MLTFILWRKINNVETIEMICDSVDLFKKQYALHKHLTLTKQYYWTREHLIV